MILFCGAFIFNYFVGKLYTNLRPNLPSNKNIFVLQLFV